MPDIPLQDYSAQVRELIRDRRFDEAIAHCQHILRHQPKHVETYSLLGECCLETDLHREAIDFFQRTLSADPENLTARVGLGVIYDRQDALAEAIWQMERAFELAPGDDRVRDELQRLYARRDGKKKDRLYLTRGALGRLYARNALHERAIAEFNDILEANPRLPDIQVALAESLWREGRRLEAVEACLNILQELPFCLKANLILGEILTRGGHLEAAKEKLGVARALDPENVVAQEVMGRDSPLTHVQVYLPLLEMAPDVLDITVIPDREEPDGEVHQVAADADAVAEPEVEPDWLQDIRSIVPGETEADANLASLEGWGAADEEPPDWLLNLAVAGAVAKVADHTEALEAGVSADMGMAPEGEPEWLGDLAEDEIEGLPDVGEIAVDGPMPAAGALAGAVDEALSEQPAVLPELDEGLPPLEEAVILPPVSEPDRDEVAAADEGLPTEAAMVEVPETGLTPRRGAETTVEEALEQMTAGPAVAAPAPEETPPSEEAVTQGAGETRASADEIPDWARELEAIGAGDHSVADPVIPPVDAPSESIPAPQATEAPSADATPADEVPEWARAIQDTQAPEPQAVESGADQPVARSRIEELQSKLEVQPGDHQARLELARLSSAEQDWDRALAQYEELVATDEVRLELIGDLRRMLDEDVDPGRVYQLLGDVYMQAGQPDEAVQMYKLARQA